MAGTVGFKVTGLSEVVRDLTRLGLEVDDLKGAFSKVASEGARVMGGFVPVRSGRLRGSVRGNKAKSKAVVMVGRASVPYAGPIQWGWAARGIAPSGFFQKTDAVMTPRALQMLEAEINKQIAAKGLA